MWNRHNILSKSKRKASCPNLFIWSFIAVVALVPGLSGCNSSSSDSPPGAQITAMGAEDDAGTTLAGTPLIINVLLNDIAVQGTTLTITAFTQPANGSVVNNGDGSFTYTPDAGFIGIDTFTYTVTGSQGGSATATVTITVTAIAPGGNPPVANADAATTLVGAPIIIDVLANDIDVDGDPLFISSFTNPNVGTLADNLDGTLTYTPPAAIGFDGNTSFTYLVSDGTGATATGTVTVAILQLISRVSLVDAVGTAGDDDSGGPSTSADGRFVAFESFATNLVAIADTNGLQDIYFHDRLTGETRRVSTGVLGADTDGDSGLPVVSADGRFVAFESLAANLVVDDINVLQDIFLWDSLTGSTVRVNLGPGGAEAIEGDSFSPAINADGSVVAFESDATNLILGDTNLRTDIFVHNRLITTTTRVSVTSGGTPGDNDSFLPALSADGNFVAFDSNATNLVPGDTNLLGDVFIHNRLTGVTERVSVAGAATQGDGISRFARISDDGNCVAFESDATNLVVGDTNATTDIFVRDRLAGSTSRVSVASDGTQALGGISQQTSISANGRFVAFESDATNLVAADTNAVTDIFVHDRVTATTRRLSVAADGTQGDDVSDSAAISPNGHYVTFESDAANIVPADNNLILDVYAAPNP